MKIEQILVLHLFNTKQLILQGIGTFRLDPSFSVPEHSHNKIIFPNNAITFDYDPKVTEDALLIDSIVHYAKKIKPLASSDLDSFLMAGKELLLLNIPFTLNGIGSIVKTQNGDFKYLPANLTKVTIPKPKAVTKKNKPKRNLFKNYLTIIRDKGKRNLVNIVVISAVSLTVLTLINFFNKKTDKKSQGQTQKLSAKDTIKTSELRNTEGQDINRKYTFKIVFFETINHEEALRKLNEITGFGHSPLVYKSDSVYKIAIAFNLPLSDTLHIKDSLDQFYSLGKGYVEVE